MGLKILVSLLLLNFCLAYDPSTVDVHIVCHSHTDAGWYQTYDSYFNEKVVRILNSTIEAVHSNKSYKFNWADTSFLAKWYRETAKPEERQKLHDIVNDGRWQFMGGGWVMNDESLTVYKNAMLQIETGIKFLEETFNVRPRIGYQIDPFGNSAVTPSILSALGYEGVVLSRIGTTFDWDLETSENSEFIWEGSDFDDKSDGKPILAHHLVRSKYQPPDEFKFRSTSFPFWVHPRVMCSNKEELNENYKDCIKLFWDEVVHPSLTGHRHNKVLSIFGEDFAFDYASYSLDYIDEFIKVNKEHFEEVTGKKINIFYSTVNEYFDAVKNFNNGDIEFPTYKGDFLPYVQLDQGTFDHWVGYYSSTPSLKQMIRHLFQRVRSLKLETVLGYLKNNATKTNDDKIREIQEEASIMMHHDAITSTSPDWTLKDYAERIKLTEKKIDVIEGELLKTFTTSPTYDHSGKNKGSLSGTKLLTVFNPLGYSRTELANFTTSTEYVQLYNSDGEIVDKAELYVEYLAQYTNTTINTTVREYIVVFEGEFQPLSMTKYFYKELKNRSECNDKCVRVLQTQTPNGNSDMKIENSHVEIEIKREQLISSYKDKWSGISIDFPTTMHTYPGNKGETTSGLYIFNPIRSSTERKLIPQLRNIQEGKLVTIVHSFYKLEDTNTTMAQSITLNQCSNFAMQRSVRVTTKMYSEELYEFTMRSNLNETFDQDYTKIYADNGADNQLKQFYTYHEAKKFNLTKNEKSYVGLNGIASIYGTALRSENDTFFGFVNSNSILVNPITKNHYEIILMRNTDYYDDKGIVDPLIDKNIETFDQILFAVEGVQQFTTVQKELSVILNDKLQVRKTDTDFKTSMDTKTDKILPNPGISAGFGDVDIIDVSINKDFPKYLNWQLRSRMPFNISLHPSFKIHSHYPKGVELNTNPPFKSNKDLSTPLLTKRAAYKTLISDFNSSMSFPTFSSNTTKDVLFGYISVKTPVEPFQGNLDAENISYLDLDTLKKMRESENEGGEEKPVDGTYPTPSSSDPKPPTDPFQETHDPGYSHDENTGVYKYHHRVCDNKDIEMSTLVWGFIKMFGIFLVIGNVVLGASLVYLKRIKRTQIHRYVMY
ncbi:unnamed protein product [Moneuplotes crassus]|uniref:Glycoside hydrolase family 38 central domain-containing protein n=1 Tax=Euplotes crassus TaxID=5936 RepID=A0AAD1ULJ8_EUPCR|nr:unnamed protein product [Moneuplotes crassus]